MDKLKIVTVRLVVPAEDVEQAREDIETLTAEIGVYDFGVDVRDLTTEELTEVIEQIPYALTEDI